ncbi:hypothetical protein B7486_54515 [cyanobacterium TDX16]|nr:hypothetical protein B7486_54515 [cyanobacterium TDX16]
MSPGPDERRAPWSNAALAPIEQAGRTGRECDLSLQCLHCGGVLREEHAHYRCTRCGQRDSCCDGPY